MNSSIWMIEQHTGHQWEPVPEGACATESEAEAGMADLIANCGWNADAVRVVEYTGDKADAYRA